MLSKFVKIITIALCCSLHHLSHAQNADIAYSNTLQVLDPSSQESISIDVTLSVSENAYSLANELKERFSLDLLTTCWLLRSFLHSQKRLQEEVVNVLNLEVNNSTQELVVRYGDDLANLARVYAHTSGMTLEEANDVFQELLKRVPEHSSQEWVSRRRKHSNLSSTAEYMPVTVASASDGTAQKKCELTVAIATAGNPNLFYNFVEKFPSTDLVCDVIIVDDASSTEVRAQMMNAYPQFTFVFKSKQDVGAVGTMNNIVRLSKSRYLLYASDAWDPIANNDSHLRQALAILKTGGENDPIVQVVLNDQSSTSCSLGRASDCSGKGGWKRTVEWDGRKVEYVENE